MRIDSSDQPSQIICNGSSGSNGNNTLVKETTLATKDANCPGGGVRIDSGLDNGAGGGVASDGVLQTGEIQSTQYVCAGDNGQRVGSVTPPAGAAGTSTLKSVGGAGTAGNGGSGSGINVGFNRGSNGGHVKLFKTGSADASFTFPAASTPDFGPVPVAVVAGANPVTVTAQASAAPADLPPGALFTYGGALYLVGVANSTPAMATGLSVAAGATLIFNLPANAESVQLGIARSVVNAGTIGVAALSATQAGGLSIACGDFFGDTGSSFNLTGAAGTATTVGGTGGALSLSADTIWNKGAIDASGGTGSPGGAGGNLNLNSNDTFFNTGAVSARGGAALGTGGGAGGTVSLYGGTDLDNSGAMDVSAGASLSNSGNATARGGNIQLGGGNNTPGSLRNSGALTSKGSSVDAACAAPASCIGGAAGSIDVATYNGSFTSNAALTATGGASPAAAGNGGQINLNVYGNSSTSYGGRTVPAGDLLLSGNIDTSGGPGATGGAAGGINVRLDTYRQPNGQEVVLLGYATIDMSGGAATATGGGAGSIDVFNNTATCTNSNGSCPGGSAVNYVDLTARGGSGGTANGGPGGSITIETQSGNYFNTGSVENVINAGNLDVSGGAGVIGGDGGGIVLYGRNNATNSGTLKSSGGAGSAGNGGAGGFSNNCRQCLVIGGGTSAGIAVYADDGAVANSGAVDVSGGASAGSGFSGGLAGNLLLSGRGVTNSASLLAAGGNADATTGAAGGGGFVILFSTTTPSVNTAAAPAGIVVKAGTAFTAGAPGVVEIDGRYVTGAWTH